jgi:CheY-like chemotaxis protein
MEKIKLLLVDDEEEFRQATAKILERRGFEVQQAESGERAVWMLRFSLPQVVILDLRMDGMDGIATLQEIRITHPHLPVIILTGHGGFEDALAGIKLQVVDFLRKPVDVVQLGNRIRRLLCEKPPPLREKSIAELMMPVSAYTRVRVDQPISVVVAALRDALAVDGRGDVVDNATRTVLVVDGDERLVGIVRPHDILRLLIPQVLRSSPYSSYFTGMFLARCKLIGHRRAEELVRAAELVDEQPTIDINAPLIKAVHLLTSRHVVNLPVMEHGQLVGILREKDLLLEVASSMLGDEGVESADEETP